jgi:uncharacterized delta-60 repeat protein
MTKAFFVSILFVAILSSNSNAQVTAQWASIYNGISNDTDQVSAIAVDNSGNVYVTGFSKTSGTGKDIATLKYNSDGQQVWVARYNNINANGDDVPTAIAFDNSGNVYVTGQSEGSGTYGDMLTIKYSSGGAEVWNDRYNGEGNDVDGATAIVVDESGNVIVTGYSVGAITSEDFTTIMYNSSGTRLWNSKYNNPSVSDIDIATSLVLDNDGNICVTGYSIGGNALEDIAVVKYDAFGNELWASRFNGSENNYDIATGIAVDANSNIYVSGYSYSSASQEDYVTVKFNSNGDELWSRTYNGSANGYDISAGIAVDQAGYVFVSGYSFGGTSEEDYATVKYNTDGVQYWEKRYNGTGNSYDIATAIKCDNAGNVYVTGYSLDPNTSEDYATLKYNTDGDLVWTEKYNGPANEGDIANTLAVDASNNVYVSGFSYEGASAIDYITVKYSQTVGINPSYNELASGFELQQNYPNPFNPVTSIGFDLPVSSYVTLEVFNTAGERVSTLLDEKQSPGHHTVAFGSTEFPSGLYIYRMTATNLSTGWSVSESRKMLLVK